LNLLGIFLFHKGSTIKILFGAMFECVQQGQIISLGSLSVTIFSILPTPSFFHYAPPRAECQEMSSLMKIKSKPVRQRKKTEAKRNKIVSRLQVKERQPIKTIIQEIGYALAMTAISSL
jgi:hypothetical protein